MSNRSRLLWRRRRWLALCLLGGAALAGCRQDMHDQPRYEPLEASRFFADGRASRLPVEGTVARGALHEDRALYEGVDAEGKLLATLPIPVDRELLTRGRDLFNAFCSPCHDRTGSGRGMIVQRGFKQPTSFHVQRLREIPVGYFFDVMTHGFGQMSSYRAQLAPRERWAIAAYIRVLQLSQQAPVEALSAEDRARLEAATSAAGAGEPSDS